MTKAVSPLPTIHIVRRYGPVGGMERYVLELTRQLAAAGHPVTVLCERNYAGAQAGIAVHELGVIAAKPRWVSLMRFSRRVALWLREHPQCGTVIHSHERVDVHHITTFHGAPFATIAECGWWRRVQLRVWMHLQLEQRELFAPDARFVVPVSPLVQAQLQHYYPDIGARLVPSIAPGVGPVLRRPPRRVPPDGGVVGFIGKEWKRKGLDLAVAAVRVLRRSRPRLQLWVAGPNPDEVAHLFAGWEGGYRLLGWSDGFSIYPQLDLLLHPALIEPYGMVVAEAMAAGVPAVVSDRCGAAANLSANSGAVLPLDAPLTAWADACERQLARSAPRLHFARGWEHVAREYEALYRQIVREETDRRARSPSPAPSGDYVAEPAASRS